AKAKPAAQKPAAPKAEAAKPQKVETPAPAAKAAPKSPENAAEKSAEKTAEKTEPRKEEKKPVTKPAFKAKEFVVYPAHGVGQILDIEEQEVAGHRLELFVINFDKEKMTLRVPTNKAQAVGMRKLSDAAVVDNAIETLRGRARIKRTMWSRRAQEYEAKINSGDLISIAEVVRDLYRSERQPEQSYSERQLYEAALDRMAREVAVVERIGEDAAIQRVEAALQGGSGRGEKAAKAAAETETEGDDENEAA
ncbi:MAG: CarD family transcriptional regulator, partial [Parvibaculum sedimenti]